VLLLISSQGYGQMYKWEMNTFKNAEKARKWRSKKKVSMLWTRKKPSKRNTRKKYTYGQSTTGPRNSRGKR